MGRTRTSRGGSQSGSPSLLSLKFYASAVEISSAAMVGGKRVRIYIHTEEYIHIYTHNPPSRRLVLCLMYQDHTGGHLNRLCMSLVVMSSGLHFAAMLIVVYVASKPLVCALCMLLLCGVIRTTRWCCRSMCQAGG
jgi:hypothetical protein